MDAETTEDLVPLDFVYCGKRHLEGGKVGVLMLTINPDGTLSDKKRIFLLSKKLDRNIGQVYSGAKFSETQAAGLENAVWKKRWGNEEDIVDWKIRDEAVELDVRKKKMENDSRRIDMIEETLLPLRKLYANYRRVHDFGGMEALEASVLRALRHNP